MDQVAPLQPAFGLWECNCSTKAQTRGNTWDTNKLDDDTDDDVAAATDLWLNLQSPRNPFMEACATVTNQPSNVEGNPLCLYSSTLMLDHVLVDER